MSFCRYALAVVAALGATSPVALAKGAGGKSGAGAGAGAGARAAGAGAGARAHTAAARTPLSGTYHATNLPGNIGPEGISKVTIDGKKATFSIDGKQYTRTYQLVQHMPNKAADAAKVKIAIIAWPNKSIETEISGTLNNIHFDDMSWMSPRK